MSELISLDYFKDLLDIAASAGVVAMSIGPISVQFAEVTTAPIALPVRPEPPAVPTDPSTPPAHPLYNTPMLFRGGKAPTWRKNPV